MNSLRLISTPMILLVMISQLGAAELARIRYRLYGKEEVEIGQVVKHEAAEGVVPLQLFSEDLGAYYMVHVKLEDLVEVAVLTEPETAEVHAARQLVIDKAKERREQLRVERERRRAEERAEVGWMDRRVVKVEPSPRGVSPRIETFAVLTEQLEPLGTQIADLRDRNVELQVSIQAFVRSAGAGSAARAMMSELAGLSEALDRAERSFGLRVRERDILSREVGTGARGREALEEGLPNLFERVQRLEDSVLELHASQGKFDEAVRKLAAQEQSHDAALAARAADEARVEKARVERDSVRVAREVSEPTVPFAAASGGIAQHATDTQDSTDIERSMHTEVEAAAPRKSTPYAAPRVDESRREVAAVDDAGLDAPESTTPAPPASSPLVPFLAGSLSMLAIGLFFYAARKTA